LPTSQELGIPQYQRKTHYAKLIKQLRKIVEDRPEATVRGWKDRSSVAQGSTDLLVRKVKAILDDQGVYSDLHHQYLAYALALDKTQSEMAWMVDLIREHQILRDRFERRNLDPEILSRIDQLVIYRTTNR